MPDGEGRKEAPRRSALPKLLAVGLAVAVAWLLAERNARQWWLVPEDGKVVVKKGVLFVTGKSPFQPPDPETARTYAPVVLPPGAPPPPEASFEDRASLDQALFDLLARAAREDVASRQVDRMERARGYLQRAARLQGLSQAQREELRGLQAGTAFQEAVGSLQDGAAALRRALEGLRLAATATGPVAAQAAVLERALEPVVGSAGQLGLDAARFAAEQYRPGPVAGSGPAAGTGPAAPPAPGAPGIGPAAPSGPGAAPAGAPPAAR